MNDFLDFDCQDKYIKFDTQMNPRCVKMGNSAQWNPQPRCEGELFFDYYYSTFI